MHNTIGAVIAVMLAEIITISNIRILVFNCSVENYGIHKEFTPFSKIRKKY